MMNGDGEAPDDFTTIDAWLYDVMLKTDRSYPEIAQRYLEKHNARQFIEGESNFRKHTIIATIFAIRDLAITQIEHPDATHGEIVEALLALLSIETWNGRPYVNASTLAVALRSVPTERFELMRFVSLLRAIVDNRHTWNELREEIIFAISEVLRHAMPSVSVPVRQRRECISMLSKVAGRLGMRAF